MSNKPEFSDQQYQIFHVLMAKADETNTNPTTLDARVKIEKYLAEVQQEMNGAGVQKVRRHETMDLPFAHEQRGVHSELQQALRLAPAPCQVGGDTQL